jgi:lipopolysaccharide transport system ATP-binding protein
MSDQMIQVENLGKMYHIGKARQRQKTLVGHVTSAIADPVRRVLNPQLAQAYASEIEQFWALRNVSFEVKQGEVLGIIGENGAGKSTLLKILSRVTAPTEGRAVLYGRVGSLLEVGTGFHPDLTGRENVYLNGTILGLPREEIDGRFDEIIDFSGVEKFIDTPVKRYSSGMFMRLAFSVAAFFDPEILILDEVLAVGDAAFQKKSLEKMESVAKSGKTVLFVSHGITSITRLCDRALWLKNGSTLALSDAVSVANEYLKYLHKLNNDKDGALHVDADASVSLESIESRWDGYVQKIFTHISTHDLDGNLCSHFTAGDGMCIRIGYRVAEPLTAYCQINFLNYTATRVMQMHSSHDVPELELSGQGTIECVFEDLRLLSGQYAIMIEVGESTSLGSRWMDCIGDAIHIGVELGSYLGGIGLSQGQVVFAQSSKWTCISDGEAG